ncbi:hypothetical protein R3P38DRAFT_2856371 [Favolaschia claudopus]|uniref:Secreted protein n=1 Tax=Favolaschia claudopus TaxID=2862362 RepID=A0AAW0DTF5_9AGAR
MGNLRVGELALFAFETATSLWLSCCVLIDVEETPAVACHVRGFGWIAHRFNSRRRRQLPGDVLLLLFFAFGRSAMRFCSTLFSKSQPAPHPENRLHRALPMAIITMPVDCCSRHQFERQELGLATRKKWPLKPDFARLLRSVLATRS